MAAFRTLRSALIGCWLATTGGYDVRMFDARTRTNATTIHGACTRLFAAYGSFSSMEVVPAPVREALVAVVGEVTFRALSRPRGRSPFRSQSEVQTPESRVVADYVVAHGWAEWSELTESCPVPGAVLAHLLAGSAAQTMPPSQGGTQVRDRRVMSWLVSTLDRWIIDCSYKDLLAALTPGELRHLISERDPVQIESFASTSPFVLAHLSLAVASESEREHPALSAFARRAGQGDADVLAHHMTETARLLRHAAVAALSNEERRDWQRVLIELLRRDSSFEGTPGTGEALDRMLDDDTLDRIILTFDGKALATLAERSTVTFQVLARRAPLKIAIRLSIFWAAPQGHDRLTMEDSSLRSAREAAPSALQNYLAPLVAYDAVVSATHINTTRQLNDWLDDHVPEAGRIFKKLWRLAALWEGARDSAARAGHESQLWELATQHPMLWSSALPALLAEAQWLELVQPLTMALGTDHPEIRACLQELVAIADRGNMISDVSARARTVLQLIDGREDPAHASYHMLVSFVARRADEGTVFPHPLELPSATWLGSRGVEELLRRLVQNACDTFSREVQLGLDEEPITAELLRGLVQELKQFPRSPWAMYGSSRYQPSRIELRYRQEAKRAEKHNGVDFALLVDIDIHKAIRLISAELVQVKKPECNDNGVFQDKWRIRLRQLRKLLKFSPTAAYLLIGPKGELYAVPAKLLLGVIQGCEQQDQRSATVSYAQIRAAAISFEQLLTQLILGLWTGGTARVVEIARGNNPNLVPRRILTLQVRAAPLDGNRPDRSHVDR